MIDIIEAGLWDLSCQMHECIGVPSGQTTKRQFQVRRPIKSEDIVLGGAVTLNQHSPIGPSELFSDAEVEAFYDGQVLHAPTDPQGELRVCPGHKVFSLLLHLCR